MSRDHFVPVTYLKNFHDPALKSRVHVYRKRTLSHVPQLPEKICVERGGDKNPYFPDNTEIVREYLSIIEPRLSSSIHDLISGKEVLDSRFIISGFIAYIVSWSPTARRLFTKTTEGQLEASRPLYAKNASKEIDDPEDAKKLAEALLDPNIKLEVDSNFPRALALRNIASTQAAFFGGDWSLIQNVSKRPFLTSDYPVGKFFPLKDISLGFSYISLTPMYGVVIRPTLEEQKNDKNEIEFRPGTITTRRAGPNEVSKLNDVIVKSAEDTIISNIESDWIMHLVKKYHDWRVEVINDTLPSGDGGIIHITRHRPQRIA